ncbi:MAG TPA: hypothetical protein VIE89_03145 [Candidatus Binatia bacterium]
MPKAYKCHCQPQAKNLGFTVTYEGEILRLSPQDDTATQPVEGEDVNLGK